MKQPETKLDRRFGHPRGEYGTAMREIERRVVQWERQQTTEQAEWVAEARRKHLSTGRRDCPGLAFVELRAQTGISDSAP